MVVAKAKAGLGREAGKSAAAAIGIPIVTAGRVVVGFGERRGFSVGGDAGPGSATAGVTAIMDGCACSVSEVIVSSDWLDLE